VRVPEGYDFKGASASEGGKVSASIRDDGLLAVTVSASSSCDVSVKLQF
jgi:hypothetical protein